MFGRRRKRSFLEKCKEWLWPSMGVARLAIYYKHRLCRISATPYSIAAGFACGTAISFTPFMGLHLFLGGLAAYTIGGSVLAMVIGTVVGNPVTFPFIWILIYKTGRFIVGGPPAENLMSGMLTFYSRMDLLIPMTIGCLPYAILSWFIGFYFAWQVVKSYKLKLRHLRMKKSRIENSR